MTPVRIYAVTDADTDEKYLVRASSRAQAIAHVSQRFGAAVASQEQLVRLLDDGVEVETAGQEPVEDPTEEVARQSMERTHGVIGA